MTARARGASCSGLHFTGRPVRSPTLLAWLAALLLHLVAAQAQPDAAAAAAVAQATATTAWTNSAVPAGKYHLRFKDKCATEDWMACSGCSSSTASTQVLVRQLAEGASPQGWQLDHTSERGDFSPFTLRPLDPSCCSNFISADPAGCGISYAVIDSGGRSKHPAEVYWLLEKLAGGGVRIYLEARQGCARRYLGAPIRCGTASASQRVLQLYEKGNAAAAVAWELIPVGSLKPRPPPPKAKPKPRPPPPKAKPQPPPPKLRPKPPPPTPKPRPPPWPRPPNNSPSPPAKPANWQTLPSPVSTVGNVTSISAFSFYVCPASNEQYAAYTSVDASGRWQTAVKRLDGRSWVDAGKPGFTKAFGSRMALGCYGTGAPSFALSDSRGKFASSSYRLPAAAASWAMVGPLGFFTSLFDISTAVDAQNRPLVAFTNSAKQYRAAVMRYDGAKWSYVGTGGDAISTAFADSIQLVVGPAGAPPGVAGVPFLCYMDYGKNSAVVKKLSGTSWTTLGAKDTMINGQLPRLAFSANGTLYLAHLIHPTFTIRLMTVRRYNAATDRWIELGSNRPAAAAFVTALDLAVDANGVPCVVFADGSNNYMVSMMCYRRSSNQWALQGPASFSKYPASFTFLAFDLGANIPSVSYYSTMTAALQLPQVVRLAGYTSYT